MNNQIIETIQGISGLALKDLAPELSLKETRKDYSRAIIDAYLNKTLSFNYKEYLFQLKLTLKTTPINKGGLTSLEPMRLCSLNLINLAQETWEESSLHIALSGLLIVPLIVEAKNLGQPYRLIGNPLIWVPDKVEAELIHEDWLMYKKYACMGAIPSKRGVTTLQLTYPPESATKFIHMKPHSVKGKFELDAFGNEVRKMAFYLNPSRLRSILLNKIIN
jgi:DNA mismatch repair endonuclease MutH